MPAVKTVLNAAMIAAIALCAPTLASGDAAAQTAAQPSAPASDDTPPLLRFVANNLKFDALVLKKASEIYALQFPECGEPEKTVRQIPTPFLETTFPSPEPAPFSPPSVGQWTEHVVITGCNENRQVNMLAVAQPDDKMPFLFATLPGTTRNDPASQQDTKRLAISSIRKYDPKCAAEPKILNTFLVGYRAQDGKLTTQDSGQGWYEQWRFAYCNSIYPAQLAFLPKPGGGYEIRVQVAKAQPNPTGQQDSQATVTPQPADPSSEKLPASAPATPKTNR